MSDPQQLERELREYLEKEPNLRRADRLEFLKSIFNKHLEFNKLEHMLNKGDLHDILSGAKFHYANAKLPVRVTKKQLDSGEAVNVSILESFIGYLNKNHLLKRLVKLDYTE